MERDGRYGGKRPCGEGEDLNCEVDLVVDEKKVILRGAGSSPKILSGSSGSWQKRARRKAASGALTKIIS
jgi:hypothetical protein